MSRLLFYAGLLLLTGFLLSLPVFPSGDGPVHMYYSQILYRLAAHKAGVYGQIYFIRHLVQPYSLHYWWLIGGEQLFTPALAEKSFVAAILLGNALGFRFLVNALGRESPEISLLILPLLLSWALGAGFLNFCFAAGMLFWTYALYLRYAESRSSRVFTGYVAALFLLVLSHPVPLLLLLLLLPCEVLLVAWNTRQSKTALSFRMLRPQLLCLGSAMLAFIFPMLIADKSSVANSLLRDLRPHAAQARAIAMGYRLSMFAGATAALIAFTAVLVASAPLAVLLRLRSGALQRLRHGQAAPADRLCLLAFVILLATILFPSSMNGSALFADRMIPLLWPLLLACAAACTVPVAYKRWIAGVATAATAASIVFAWMYLLPAARQQAALTMAALPRGAKGLFVTDSATNSPLRLKLAGNWLAWGGARAFAAHDDVLLNSPWMQLTIVPVGEQHAAGLLRDSLPGQLSESPADLGRLLQTRDEASRRALRSADFLLYSAPASDADTVASELPSYLPANPRPWRCTVYDFYAVCIRTDAP